MFKHCCFQTSASAELPMGIANKLIRLYAPEKYIFLSASYLLNLFRIFFFITHFLFRAIYHESCHRVIDICGFVMSECYRYLRLCHVRVLSSISWLCLVKELSIGTQPFRSLRATTNIIAVNFSNFETWNNFFENSV